MSCHSRLCGILLPVIFLPLPERLDTAENPRRADGAQETHTHTHPYTQWRWEKGGKGGGRSDELFMMEG